MEFKEVYTCVSEKDLAINKSKKIISDDIFALAEAIHELNKNIFKLIKR